MFAGVLLMLLGLLMLLERTGSIVGDVWDLFIPIALIALGTSFIFRRKKDNCC